MHDVSGPPATTERGGHDHNEQGGDLCAWMIPADLVETGPCLELCSARYVPTRAPGPDVAFARPQNVTVRRM